MDSPAVNGVDVEVHSTPCFFYTYHRMPMWFMKNFQEQAKNCVCLYGRIAKVSVPTNRFNAVYQLVHIYKHVLFDEGIGLRQLLDYYYMVESDFSDEEKLEIIRDFIAVR